MHERTVRARTATGIVEGFTRDGVHRWRSIPYARAPVGSLRFRAADFHPSLDTSAIEAVFYKGAYTGAYSGFEGVDENGTPLLNWLRQRGVDEVDVVGIATDHCVRQTAEDAVRNGLATRVLVDLTAGVSADTTVAALEEMRTASVELVCSS